MTTSDRLIKRIRDTGYNLGKNPIFTRLYPGYWQRRAGAWCWKIQFSNAPAIGSHTTATKCSRAKTITITSDRTVYADD